MLSPSAACCCPQFSSTTSHAVDFDNGGVGNDWNTALDWTDDMCRHSGVSANVFTGNGIPVPNNNTWGLGFSEEGLVFGSTAHRNPSVYVPIANRYYEQVRGWSVRTLLRACRCGRRA